MFESSSTSIQKQEISMSQLPLKLRRAPQLYQWIVTSVSTLGGGFKIKNWNDSTWVSNLTTKFTEQSNISNEEKKVARYLLQLSKKRSIGTYIIQMYLLNFYCYCTNERITHLESISDVVNTWSNSYVSTKNAHNWRNYLKDSTLWKNVPGYSF
jgi:hypothetical protein